ncbi:MAG: 50S ribosomal protein L15e [Candidatus Micrarchaeota archaeon]|nr:50S ribosomal protein L15e [Candidatus Micrarchaeota archaeon]
MESEYKNRSDEYKTRIIKWNAESSITRVDKPTNIARARELGYKAKEGVIIVRVKLKGGSKKRKHAAGGRKPSKSGRYFTKSKSLQAIAEERAARKFTNFEPLNSYFVGAAGSRRFYEVILLNKGDRTIISDPQYRNVARQNGRAYRGLTSSGKRHRGIIRKRFGSHKLRPSQNRFKI